MSIQSEINRISGNVSDALDAIEAKGVTIPTGANSDDLANLIGQISGGGGGTGGTITQDQNGYLVLSPDGGGGGSSSWTLIGSKEITANITSTSAVDVDTIATDPTAYTEDKIIYVRSRDKAGKRAGYYYGTDCFRESGSQNNVLGVAYRSQNGVSVSPYIGNLGLYASSVDYSGNVTISARYHSVYSTTIDGTFIVEVYALAYPDGKSPYD